MKGGASQLRGAAAVGRGPSGRQEPAAVGRPEQGRTGPGGHGSEALGECGQTTARWGSRNWEGEDRRKALAEGSVLMGTSPACEQVCLQVAKPGLGGCPPQGDCTWGWECRTHRGAEWVGPGAEGSFLVDTGTRRCRPVMIGQGLGTQLTLRLGRSGLREGKRVACRVTGGTAWRKKGRALCSPHCAGRGLGHHGCLLWARLEAEETPPWRGPALPRIVRWASQEGSACSWCPPHPPHTARLAGLLHHQRPGGSEEADISGSSVFPAIPVPGLGLRRQTGVGKGAGGAGRGQPPGGDGGGGGVPSRKTPPPAEVPRAQVKVWSE